MDPLSWISISIAAVLWISGIPIFAVFAVCGLIFLVSQGQSMILMPLHFFQAMNVYSLISVAFFILAGNIMVRTHSSDPLFRAAAAWVGHFRGGLAIGAVVASMLFGAISASSLATMTAIGSFAVPSMTQAGYDPKKSMAYLCACGGLGNLIPPSLCCIVFAALTGAPVLVLFMAGIFPGLVITVMLSVQAMFIFKTRREKATWKERWEATIRAIPPLLIPIFVLGSLYAGYATTVEVSILACVLALIIAAWYAPGEWKTASWNALVDIAGITSFIFFIFAASSFFIDMFAFAQIPQKLVMFLTSGELGKNALMLLIMVSLFIAGAVMDVIPLLFFVVPLTYQAIIAADIHYITYNFMLMQTAAIGFCTPPFAIGIFTMAVLFKVPAQTLFKTIWPFILTLIVHAFLFIYWEDGLLWLPRLLFSDSILGG